MSQLGALEVHLDEPEFNGETFVDYWNEVARLWNRINAVSHAAKDQRASVREVKDLILRLVRAAETFGNLFIPDRYFRSAASRKDFLGESTQRPKYLTVGELFPPFDEANVEYLKLLPDIQVLVWEVSEQQGEFVTDEFADFCGRNSILQYVSCRHVIGLIHSSLDPELSKVVFQRAYQLLEDQGDTGHSGVPTVKWDGRRLMVGDTVATEFRRLAKNQAAILEAFQIEDWPERIDDPLPYPVDSQRLRETVANLNERQQVIQFMCDGTGTGVQWKMRG